MIPISRIDSELSIYKNATVIIWGTGKYGSKISNIFKMKNINIKYFCDNDESKWGQDYQGVEIISPTELKHLFSDGKDICVQLALNSKYENSVISQLNSLGIENFISYNEFINMYSYYNKCDVVKQRPELPQLETSLGANAFLGVTLQSFFQHVYMNWDDLGFFVCMPLKTGDHTIL